MKLFEQIVAEEGQVFLGWRRLADRQLDARATAPGRRAGDVPRARRPRPDDRRRRRASSASSSSSASGSRTAIEQLGARRPQVLLLRQPLVPHARLQGDAHARAGRRLLRRRPRRPAARPAPSAMFHSRFSTNTFPSWELAHPYRMISHNGEINTLRGNINWMRAREALFASDLYEPGDVEKLLPIIREGLSDTACLDNAVELLVKSGYSLPARDDDADPRGVGEPRDDVAGEEGLLRLPRLPDGALGRPGVDRLHRRQEHRRGARPQRPAAQPLLSSPRTTW